LIFWLIIGVILFFASSRIGLFIIAIVLFYFLFYIKKAYQYALTNKRLLAKRGWLSTSLISIEYEKITDILVKQGFLDKSFFDVGVLAINTAGTGGHELIMKNIGEPYRVKQELYEKIEQSKEVYKGKKQSGQTNGGIDDLEKLAKLKEKGIITQEEFEAKKKQVLGL